MKTRLVEIEDLISENRSYMDSVYEIIRLRKSDLAAKDFLSKLSNRIGLENEKREILKNLP